MNTFTWPLEFNKPIAVNEEILGHGILIIQGVHICDGSSKARIFVTINGEKFVVANLDPARRVSSSLNLMITAENGEVQFSCSQGAKVVLTGNIEMDSCCGEDHDHEHDEQEESEAEEELENEDDAPIIDGESEDEEMDSEMSEDDEEDDEEEDDEEDSEEDDEEEESEDEPVSPPSKKVTFNPKEQGPHKTSTSPEPTPLKPAIKQTPVPAAQPASKVGVTETLPGGLKYTILTEGRGPVAANGRTVNVKYDGCLASNGKRFDKGAIKFKLGAGDVIQGWDKGVKDMRVGETRRLLIPAHLGYGKRGAPPAIPGNAALVFEVQLLNVQ